MLRLKTNSKTNINKILIHCLNTPGDSNETAQCSFNLNLLIVGAHLDITKRLRSANKYTFYDFYLLNISFMFCLQFMSNSDRPIIHSPPSQPIKNAYKKFTGTNFDTYYDLNNSFHRKPLKHYIEYKLTINTWESNQTIYNKLPHIKLNADKKINTTLMTSLSKVTSTNVGKTTGQQKINKQIILCHDNDS